jgi:hypothetical protein
MPTATPVVPPTPLIDWHVLGQVLLASVTIGVALVTLFSLGVASLSASRSQGASGAIKFLGRLGVTVSTGLVGSVLVWGFYIITQKG